MTEICPICLKEPFPYGSTTPEARMAEHMYWHHCHYGYCFCGKNLWPANVRTIAAHIAQEGGAHAHLLAFTMGVPRG